MIKIIMCGSTLSTKGGMVSVIRNYLNYDKWDEYKIRYIPTHFDTNKYLLIGYFGVEYLRILVLCIWGGYKIAHLHTAERGSFWRKRFLLNTFHKLGVKVILHHHAAEFEDFYNRDCTRIQRMKVCNTLAEADINIVLSRRLVSMIKDKEPKSRVEVLYNAVNVYKKNPYNLKARNVLFMGRLGVRKGIFDLLEAIRRLDNQIPKDVKFYLCGDMGEDVVYAEVKKLGIGHRVAHIGWINSKQKCDFMSKSMINCLPSYNEGLPMTILETMAAGIPNISTNIASIPEVLCDGKNGFLITPGDIDTLTDRLKLLITDEGLRKQFSTASYDLVTTRFSLDANIDKLKSYYKTL